MTGFWVVGRQLDAPDADPKTVKRSPVLLDDVKTSAALRGCLCLAFQVMDTSKDEDVVILLQRDVGQSMD